MANRTLQRLNDRRRSVALAGLAAGAAVAALVRRKKRGEETEFGKAVPIPQAPEPVVPPIEDRSGPLVEAEIPPAPPVSPIVEPATGELSAEEASILAVLAQSGRLDDDRTALAVATSLERETTDVAAVLRKLGAEGVVSGELYTAAGEKIWAVTERGVRRLGAQS